MPRRFKQKGPMSSTDMTFSQSQCRIGQNMVVGHMIIATDNSQAFENKEL